MTLKVPSLGLALAEEASVVALAQAGDERAFAELVHRRQTFVRNLLRRLCRDPSLADDLAQEAFMQAWRQLPRLRAPGAFGGWLRQVAVSIWLQHLRKTQTWAPLVDNAHGESSTPADNVALDLDSALAHLSADARLCVVLAYHEGLTHREIADETGLPLGTIKSHIARGAARLKELLNSYDRSMP